MLLKNCSELARSLPCLKNFEKKPHHLAVLALATCVLLGILLKIFLKSDAIAICTPLGVAGAMGIGMRARSGCVKKQNPQSLENQQPSPESDVPVATHQETPKKSIPSVPSSRRTAERREPHYISYVNEIMTINIRPEEQEKEWTEKEIESYVAEHNLAPLEGKHVLFRCGDIKKMLTTQEGKLFILDVCNSDKDFDWARIQQKLRGGLSVEQFIERFKAEKLVTKEQKPSSPWQVPMRGALADPLCPDKILGLRRYSNEEKEDALLGPHLIKVSNIYNLFIGNEMAVGYDPSTRAQALQTLKDKGIEYILCCLPESENFAEGSSERTRYYFQGEKSYRGEPFRYERIPLGDVPVTIPEPLAPLAQINEYDRRRQAFFGALPRAFAFLSQTRVGGAVIHCNAGISRSAAVLIAYLMWQRQASLEEVYRDVFNERPVNISNFEAFLREESLIHLIRLSDAS